MVEKTFTNDDLTPEDLARSCFRAFSAAVNVVPEHGWEGLALETQAPWMLLASRGPRRLESLEGLGWKAIAREIWLETLADRSGAGEHWDDFPDEFRLAWEAVARHLATLLDADDVDNIPALEQSWRKWLLKRLPQPEVAKC